MAATIAGAIKAHVEAAGLGLACYRDAAPSHLNPKTGKLEPSVPLPYVTVRERIAASNDPDGVFDDDVIHSETETVQVDLWQRWRTDSGGRAESYTLARDLRQLLRTVDLTGLPFRVYGTRVAATARLLEPVTNVVHDVLTLTVRREV